MYALPGTTPAEFEPELSPTDDWETVTVCDVDPFADLPFSSEETTDEFGPYHEDAHYEGGILVDSDFDAVVISDPWTETSAEPKFAPYQAPKAAPVRPEPPSLYNHHSVASVWQDARGEQFRWVEEWNSWLHFDGLHWASDNPAMTRCMSEVITSLRDDEGAVLHAAKEAAGEEAAKDPGVKQAASRFGTANSYLNRANKLSVIAEARDLEGVAVGVDEFNRNPYLLGVKNGTIDLRTGTLLTGNATDLITVSLPTVYDPTAVSSDWAQFVNNITCEDKDLARYLQKVAGIALSGEVVDKVFFLFGNGANGKSVFTNTLMELMGPVARVLPDALITKSQQDVLPWDIAKLFGARMLLASELDENVRLNEKITKRLASTEKLTGAFKGKQPFEFQLQSTTFVTMNHKPLIDGQDMGIWRRVSLIPFLADFSCNPDRGIENRLKQQLSGILNWALEGYRMWKDEGLVEPDSIRAASAEYRKDMDVLGKFMEESLVVTDDKARVKRSTVYAVYQEWCKDNGHKPASSTVFHKRLGERGMETVKYSGNFCYKGFELRNEILDAAKAVNAAFSR